MCTTVYNKYSCGCKVKSKTDKCKDAGTDKCTSSEETKTQSIPCGSCAYPNH